MGHESWDTIDKKVSLTIGALRGIRDFIDRATLVSVFNALIRPQFDYFSEVLTSLVPASLTDYKNSRIGLQE